MSTFWHSIRRPTVLVPSVMSYCIRIHSLCCLCYNRSVYISFESDLITEVDMLLHLSLSRIFPFLNFIRQMPTSSPSSSSSLSLSFSEVFYKALYYYYYFITHKSLQVQYFCCSLEIHCRTAITYAAFKKTEAPFTSKLKLYLKNKIVKGYCRYIALFGAVTWSLSQLNQKELLSFGMWCWRMKLKTIWTVSMRNKEVQHRVRKEVVS